MKRGLYLVEGGGYHKIGMTSNLDERLKALRLAVPFELKLVAFQPLTMQKHLRPAELALHRRFETSRVRPRSEWFCLTTDQVQECTTELLKQPETKTEPKLPTRPRFGTPEWIEEARNSLRNPVA